MWQGTLGCCAKLSLTADKGLNHEEIDEINQPFDYYWEYWKNEKQEVSDCATSKAMLESFMMDRRVLFL